MYIKMKTFLFLIADQCHSLGTYLPSLMTHQGCPPYKGLFGQDQGQCKKIANADVHDLGYMKDR